MSKNSPSKDGTLEALDFILNVIKEHDKDLERISNQLAAFAKRSGERSELKAKLEKIEINLDNLQKDINKIAKCLIGPS